MGNDSVLCQVCQGVLPASGRAAYTPARGRLIVSNGYCDGGCAERAASRGQQGVQQQSHQPQGQSPALPVRQPGQGVPAGHPVRVLT